MNSDNIILAQDSEVRPVYLECEFTVESRGGIGGDWEKNVGSSTSETRVKFKGYADATLIDTLAESMKAVIER